MLICTGNKYKKSGEDDRDQRSNCRHPKVFLVLYFSLQEISMNRNKKFSGENLIKIFSVKIILRLLIKTYDELGEDKKGQE